MANRRFLLLARFPLMFSVALVPASYLAAQQSPAGKPEAQAKPTAEADPAKGKALFASASCGDCHALADAGAAGIVGPSLDQNPALTRDLLLARMREGQGAMPGYSGQLGETEMVDVAAYVLKAAAK